MIQVDEDDDAVFECDCGCTCEDRIHMVGLYPLYGKQRKLFIGGLGKIECERVAVESQDCENYAIKVRRDGHWPEKATVQVGRTGEMETF